MALRLIEAYDDADLVHINGRSYPQTCLVEDDNGLRLLLLPNTDVPMRVWMEAQAAGAAALFRRSSDGLWDWVNAERFADNRIEDRNRNLYICDAWQGPITVPEYIWEVTVAEQVPGGFVNLHTHSEYSALDGLSRMEEIVREITKDGQTSVAITDHGVCAGHPELQRQCDKAGVKPIFGMEGNLVQDRFRRGDSEQKNHREVRAEYRHILLWAMDNEGLRNLWAISTEGFRDGFYDRPRFDYSTMARHSKGVMASTSCLRGPLAEHLLAGRDDEARIVLAKLMEIFPGRLYIEIHTNQLEEQIELNQKLVTLAREYDLPLVAAVDSHYPCVENARDHKVWVAMSTGRDVDDESQTMFQGAQDYHLGTEAEVRKALAYLGDAADEAIANTVRVAERCNARIEGKSTTPIFSKEGGHSRDAKRVLEMALDNWDRKVVGKNKSEDEYLARFEREYKLLVDKNFCGYFLMVAEQVNWAKDNGILVGPGRGSGGGSLVAYLLNITEVDPVDADLLFERFLTDGRTSLPDFDIDYPSSKKAILQAHVAERYGQDYVINVGTHSRLRNKGVVKKLASALKTEIPDMHWPDLETISKIIGDAESGTAGLGLSWDELWAQEAELLQPFRDKYPVLFDYADRMVGRLNTYGRHAAGIVISTDEPLTGSLPLRLADEGDHQMISQFEMSDLELLGYVKFDLLNLRTLDTLQMAVDDTFNRLKFKIDFNFWVDEYHDPQVWEDVSRGNTLGIFQIETDSGTRLTKRFKPQNIHDLADVMTLVRPGPVRSGLTETYLRRKMGVEEVTYPDPRLESVLSRTYGCILYQEDVMAVCMVLGGYDSNEADTVRKILGKKQVEKVQAEGTKFVSRVVENGGDKEMAEHLWEQMAEFAKYSFNRAHAYAYAMIGYWCAWLKEHFVVSFMTAALSTVDDKRIPAFITDARRMGYEVLPPDINESTIGFIAGQMAVRYGLDAVPMVGVKAVEAILPHQPFASFEDFITRVVEPKGSKCNMGHVKALARVGAFDSLVPNRHGLVEMLEREASGDSTTCIHKRLDARGPNDLPCVFDWSSEPLPINPKTGKEMKQKPIPKRCTIRCRNYEAPPALDLSGISPYTDEEIRDIEMEMLGVYLSSTPFDVLGDDLQWFVKADELADAPEGEYDVAGIITSVDKRADKNGNPLYWITMNAQNGDVRLVVFSKQVTQYKSLLTKKTLICTTVRKTGRGINLINAAPVGSICA